jgi:hypothetical protein
MLLVLIFKQFYICYCLDCQGEMTYTTFRNGRVVRETGQKAMLLSIGDKKSKSKNT